MAYDWSSLLGDIESFTVRRGKSLLDEEDERRRRAGAMRIAIAAEPSQQRSMPSGIVRKSRMTAVSAHDDDHQHHPAAGAGRAARNHRLGRDAWCGREAGDG